MWFDVKTCYGINIYATRQGRLCQGKSAPGFTLYRPAPGKPLAFLVSPDLAARFHIHPSLYKAFAIPVLIKSEGAKTYLTHVEERRFLSVKPIKDQVLFSEIHANEKLAGERETFEIEARTEGSETPAELQFVQHLDALLAVRNDAGKLAQLLSDELSWNALEAVIPLLSQPVKSALSHQFIDEPSRLMKIMAYGKADPWLATAAPDLSLWLSGRLKDQFWRASAIGPEQDFLAARYLPELRRGIRPVGAGEVLVRNRRMAVKPRRRACVLATARNEGIYYLEWIAYHRALGFEDFFIYTNDNDDHSEELLRALAQAGIIHLVESSLHGSTPAQQKAYGHALGFHPAILNFDWVMTCDLDEFLLLDKDYFANIDEYLSWHEHGEVDAISVSWGYVSASGQTKWDERPLFDRFASRRITLGHKVKSLFRPGRAAQSYAHFPSEFDGTRLIFRNAFGEIRKYDDAAKKHGIYGRHLDDEPDYRGAEMLHYYWKSAEEFLWKCSRNRGDHKRTATRSIELIDHNALALFLTHFGSPRGKAGPTAARRLVPGFDKELASLRALPRVAAAEAKIKAHFIEALGRIKAEFIASAAVQNMGETGQAFLRLLQDEKPAPKRTAALNQA